MRSAILHLQPVDDYLDVELQAGHIIGPLPDILFVQISRFGVIPKAGEPGKNVGLFRPFKSAWPQCE